MSLLASSMLALTLTYAGMAGLCMAMDRHYVQATGRQEMTPFYRLALRLSACVLLLVSLQVCTHGLGSGVGWVAWLGYVTAGALLVAGLWAWRPRLAVATAAVSGIAGLLAFVLTCSLSTPA
jgi:hypothetical protein